jgi:predicted transposase YbfD/YdcC
MRPACLLEALATVPDPRSRRGRSYPFTPILTLLVVGILVGRRSPEAITQLADDYGGDFALLLGFPRRRVPTASMLSKLLRRIDVAALETVLSAWIATHLPSTDPLVVNIDGKCLRGSAQPSVELPGVHLLAAYAPRVQAVLAQLRVDAKTNEHKAALELLNILPQRTGGYIFTADAMFTQTEVCQAIRDRNDDFRVRRWGIRQGKPYEEMVHGITSLPPERADAKRLLELVREHWRIENSLHYIRDVTLGEDASQVRCGAAPEVLAAFRNVAVHLLNRVHANNHTQAIRRLSARVHDAFDLLASPV